MVSDAIAGRGAAFVFWPDVIAVEGSLGDPHVILYLEEMNALQSVHDEYATQQMADYLNGGENRHLLVHSDRFRSPGWGQREGIRVAPGEVVVVYRDGCDPSDDDPWIVLSGPGVSADDVNLTFARGMLYPPSFGILTEAQLPVKLRHGTVIDKASAQRIIGGMQQVIVTGFDGQAFVFWERSAHRFAEQS
jgi:hypothetical protein